MPKKEIDELIKTWQKFVDAQANGEFILNPQKDRVLRLAKGVLENEKNHGLKYCPCRLTTGDKIQDLELVCPCNFKIQKTWKEIGECWCSLFVKVKKSIKS